MLEDIKHTIKQSAVYGLSRISSKAVSFILLPIITYRLSVAEFGIYVRIDALWQILLGVILFGIENGVIYRYLEIKEGYRRKRFHIARF